MCVSVCGLTGGCQLESQTIQEGWEAPDGYCTTFKKPGVPDVPVFFFSFVVQGG